MQPLVDTYGRQILSVRISLTDRCNFRCVYCTPPDGFEVSPGTEYLSIDEVVRLATILGRCGVTRIRITGGEPLLRRDILDVVRSLHHAVPALELSMTTNASRLALLAGDLRSAGLDRVNVSLDSLDPERFAAVARADQYQRVLDGIAAALRVGFPVKVNVVVLRGMTEQEILSFVGMAVEQRMEVRFLEFMPLCGDGWDDSHVYPIAEVREVVRSEYKLIELPRGDRTAQSFDIEGSDGRVGFIGSLSEPFCADCSRMRISAEGRIRPCLFSDYEVELKSVMRGGAADADIERVIRGAVAGKPAGSQFADQPFVAGDGGTRVVNMGPSIRRVGG